METKKSALPADVPLKDGRTVRIMDFQAKSFIDNSAADARAGIRSHLELSLSLLTRIAFFVSIDGEGNETISQLTDAELNKLKKSETLTLLEKLGAEISVTAKGEDWLEGVLPSGKTCRVQELTTEQFRKAGTLHGEDLRIYAEMSLACTIDGKAIDFIDVQMMPGLDYVAIQTILNNPPW